METFPRYWPFVRWIHRSPVNSLHKGQWFGALMFSLIYTWTYSWVKNRNTRDLRRHRTHCDVIVMSSEVWWLMLSMKFICISSSVFMKSWLEQTNFIGYHWNNTHPQLNIPSTLLSALIFVMEEHGSYSCPPTPQQAIMARYITHRDKVAPILTAVDQYLVLGRGADFHRNSSCMYHSFSINIDFTAIGIIVIKLGHLITVIS